MTTISTAAKRAELYKPREIANGGLAGIFRIWNGSELLMERESTLSKGSDYELCMKALGTFEFTDPEATMSRVVNIARQSIEAARDLPVDAVETSALRMRSLKIIEDMSEKGRWLKAPDDYYYMNGKTPIPVPINSLDMDVILNEKFHVNGTERVSTFVKAEMVYHTARQGEPVKLHTLSHHDPVHNKLYVYCGDGQVLRLDGAEVTTVENGVDGVLFKDLDGFEPWEYTPDHGYRLSEELIKSFNFAPGGECPFDPEDQQTLYLIYLICLFFGDSQPTKPLLLAAGEPGSGKTSMLRAIGQILIGSEFEVDSLDEMREEFFWTAVTNNRFLVYDNLDSRVKWLENALAKVATGSRVSKRKSHTTNEFVKFKVDCFLGLTAFNPRFRRPDVSERLLILRLERRPADKRMPESVFQDRLAKHRHLYLSELVDRCNDLLFAKPPKRDDSQIRMSDFARMARWVAAAMDGPANGADWTGKVEKILDKVRMSQQQFAGEDNPLVLALKQWALGSKEGQLNYTREVLTSQLNDELRGIAERDLKLTWRVANGAVLGRQLAIHAEVLSSELVIEKVGHSRSGTTYRIRYTDQAPVASRLV